MNYNKRLPLVIVLMLGCLLTVSVTVNAYKPLVAVMPVEEGDLSWKGFNEDEILNGITEQLTDRLVELETMRIVERSRINEIMNEQNFNQSSRIDQATAIKIGKTLGVDILIISTLTQMEVKESGEISFGPVSLSGVKAAVVITGRAVDTKTAEIKTSFKGRGEERDTSISLSDLQGLSVGTEAFENSVLGKGIEEAVEQFVTSVKDKSDKLLIGNSNLLTGKVVKVLNNKLIINIGRSQKLVKEQSGTLVRKIEVEELEEAVRMPIGKVKVFSVDNHATIVEVISKEEFPQKGDIVEFEVN